MEYTPQNLEYAVSVFYNGEQTERARAHAWLTAAQRVPEAWKFVWELLQPDKGTEIQFYAATTLHTKILRCWNEVPPESYDELREKLLQAVHTYAKGPKIVTNRLCISLAAFILQQGAQDLAAVLHPLSAPEHSALLLEVLTVIPEEFSSMTMGSSLRAKNRAALQRACPMVLDDMLRCLNSVYNDYSKEPPSESTMQAWTTAATCAGSWLALEDGDGAALADRLPLCRALLAVCTTIYNWNSAVSDTALDACEACLSAVRAAGGAGGGGRHPSAALQLAACLAATAAPVLQRDNVPNSINEELLSALITCMVCVVETHAHTLVAEVSRAPPAASAAEGLRGVAGGAGLLLELLLDAQAAPGHYPLHETRSNLVMAAWYTLQDEVLNVSSCGGGGGGGGEGEAAEVCGVWRALFSRLLATLVRKAEAHDATLGKDDEELLRCYRQDIADTVMYCYGVLGDWCWSLVEAEYVGAASDARREAALHVLLALADAAPAQRAPPPLLNMLQHAVAAVHNTNDKRALNTALDCLGGYAGWLSSAGGGGGGAGGGARGGGAAGGGAGGGTGGGGLGGAMVVAAGAALERSPAAAARALRRLCADCTAPAAHLAPHIVRAAQSPVGRSDTWVRRQLLGAAGAALAGADPSTAAPLLQQLATALHHDMRAQARSPGVCTGAAECCAALMCALVPSPALAQQLLRAVLPTLPDFATQPALLEPLFAVLKATISTLMDDCAPHVNDLAQLTATAFDTRPCAPGLDVVKLLVLVLGGGWAEAGRLLAGCVAAAARAVCAPPAPCPDLTEGLFLLLLTITKKKPHYLDSLEELLPELVDLGCSCVRLWEAGAARAACGWLAALCALRPAALQASAPALTAAACRCIGGATPRNQIEPLAELLLALNRAAWSGGAEVGLSLWLRQALSPEGFPTLHATDQHKHKFIAAVVKEKSSKRRLLESVQEFSLACRGLIGTEYARQTVACKQLLA